ncbi:hypothetical protein F1D05_29840 [Kribbella qitaiheensis]|uniref:Cupin domain-containing protein n=1 Tax=Kribbella qitaiheensis TaxID=1544730 RepID=A0A7G6X540_9ACTN|nr:hypothetical protein [Kribbella qitaiheensis]QNE21355.1 hypothetical protein F1D05_29840 [Kribbella qitaiheensis]
MPTVTELFATFPFDHPPRRLLRDELALLSPAVPKVPGVSWDPIPPLKVVHFDQDYQEGAFIPPRILWEGDTGRIEWMQMNFRQPMYHRNLDVDEMSYQIRGGRTLMTELGTVELEGGDLVRIPCGVAHDNFGRKASHILWYFPTPLRDVGEVVRTSEVLIPPFEGWEAATVNEVHTDCLGGRHCDRAVQLSDERLILEQAHQEDERLQVLSTKVDENQTQWIWQGAQHAVGVTDITDSDGREYLRRRNADEVQYQIEGTRLLVSANGVVEMTPGTFVHIPVGVAYASIVAGSSRHLSTVTTGKLDCVWEAATESSRWNLEDIEAYRARAFAKPVS